MITYWFIFLQTIDKLAFQLEGSEGRNNLESTSGSQTGIGHEVTGGVYLQRRLGIQCQVLFFTH